MNLPIAILLIVGIVALTVYIFRHAMKKEDLGKDGCSGYKGCASCAASEYCNHITSLEKFADERDKEKEDEEVKIVYPTAASVDERDRERSKDRLSEGGVPG